MSLPKIEAPTFTMNLTSIKKPVTYRPFLVKEEKLLLMAMEGGEQEEIVRTSLIFEELAIITLAVPSSFTIALNGKQSEFGIDPVLTFFLGSGALPSNLSLLLASITKKSFILIFELI